MSQLRVFAVRLDIRGVVNMIIVVLIVIAIITAIIHLISRADNLLHGYQLRASLDEALSRAQLKATLGNEARDVEVAEYVPKMNVTPNAVATKDD
jgi:hypothetical protein